MGSLNRLEALVHGSRTSYLQSEGGPPLLVLQGLLGRDASVAAETSTGDHTVFAPDLPGFWSSEPPNQRLSIPWLGKWAEAFHANVVNHPELSVMGFSAGATFLIHYAATHPGAVKKMVLYEPIIRGGELPVWLKGFITLSIIPGMAWLALKGGPNLLPMLSGVRGVGWERRYRLVQGATMPRCAGELAQSLLGWDAESELRSLGDTQVLVIHGSDPSFVSYVTLRSLEGGNISLLEVPGHGHLLGKRGQEAVATAAKDFLTPSGSR